MSTVKQDREELKRLVESYGKDDVLNYVNHLNESFLGIAGAIVAGLIGFKLVKGLLIGLIGTGMAVKAKQKIAELEECQAEMTEILSKYPDVQEDISKMLKNRLNYVKVPKGSSLGERIGRGLPEMLEASFEQKDYYRFLQLFKQVQYIQDEAFKYYDEETLEKLGGKTSFASKLGRAMFN